MHKDFRQSVLQIVSTIPRGSTLSYGEVARRTGNPKAARAVGSIMRANHDPDIPCHRVICSNGKIGGFNRGVNKKVALLKAELLSNSDKKHRPKTKESQKTNNIRGRGDENVV